MEDHQIYNISFTSNGKEVCASDHEYFLTFYNVDDGNIIRRLGPATSNIRSHCFTKDELFVATGTMDGHIQLYDISTGLLEFTFQGHKLDIWGIDFAPNEQCLYSAGRDGKVIGWSIPRGNILIEKKVYDNELNCIAVSPDGKFIVIGTDDGTVIVFDESLKELTKLFGHTKEVFRLKFICDGAYLVTSDFGGVVRVWDFNTLEVFRIFRQTKGIMGIAYSSIDDIIITGTESGKVVIQEVYRGNTVSWIFVNKELRSLAFNQLTSRIAIGGSQGEILILNIGSSNVNTLIPSTLVQGNYKYYGRSDGNFGIPSLGENHVCDKSNLQELPLSPNMVHFTITSPISVPLGEKRILDVWAHLKGKEHEALERARSELSEDRFLIKTKGPALVEIGSTIMVRLEIENIIVDDPVDYIVWDGTMGNATFLISVPSDISTGIKTGKVLIYLNGIQLARLYFKIRIGKEMDKIVRAPLQKELPNRAFASYASLDRDAVFARIQGIQKILPGLDIFLDVLSLRAGQLWEKQLFNVIPENDVFYLFWSINAKESEWVEKEWRCALEKRGLEFIDPIPLVSADEALPPPELASLHFDDWTLGFKRNQK